MLLHDLDHGVEVESSSSHWTLKCILFQNQAVFLDDAGGEFRFLISKAREAGIVEEPEVSFKNEDE